MPTNDNTSNSLTPDELAAITSPHALSPEELAAVTSPHALSPEELAAVTSPHAIPTYMGPLHDWADERGLSLDTIDDAHHLIGRLHAEADERLDFAREAREAAEGDVESILDLYPALRATVERARRRRRLIDLAAAIEDADLASGEWADLLRGCPLPVLLGEPAHDRSADCFCPECLPLPLERSPEGAALLEQAIRECTRLISDRREDVVRAALDAVGAPRVAAVPDDRLEAFLAALADQQ